MTTQGLGFGGLEIRAALRWLVSLLYLLAGIAHLMAADTLLKITPGWVPFPRETILVSGVLEIGCAALIQTTKYRKLAGAILAVYALCVWPANFKHALDHIDLVHVPSTWWYHGPRLALQPVIVWLALYASGIIDWPFRSRANAPDRIPAK